MFCKDETGVAEVLIAARADLTARTMCDYAAAARARALVRSPHVALHEFKLVSLGYTQTVE